MKHTYKLQAAYFVPFFLAAHSLDDSFIFKYV